VVHLKKALAREILPLVRLEKLFYLVDLVVVKALTSIAGAREGLQLFYAESPVAILVEASENLFQRQLAAMREPVPVQQRGSLVGLVLSHADPLLNAVRLFYRALRRPSRTAP